MGRHAAWSAGSTLLDVTGGFQSWGAHRALCTGCAKSRLFLTKGSHGSQGPEFCTLQPLLVQGP